MRRLADEGRLPLGDRGQRLQAMRTPGQSFVHYCFSITRKIARSGAPPGIPRDTLLLLLAYPLGSSHLPGSPVTLFATHYAPMKQKTVCASVVLSVS